MTSQVILLFGAFGGLIVCGVPVAVALGLASVLVMVLDPDIPMWIAVQRSFSGIDNFVLLAIPFFILSGTIMNDGKVTPKLIRLATALVGHIRGGLAHVTIVVGMIFAGISGSSTAECAAISSVFIPALRERGYRENFAVALAAAASTMGVIIPPSILMVIYGGVANISIGALLIGGALPGVLIGLSLMGFAYVIAILHGYPKEHKQWLGIRATLAGLWEASLPLGVPAIVLGGIVGGIFTPTEAAIVASVYSIVITSFIYRSLGFWQAARILADTAVLTASILFCVIGASMFGWLLAFYKVPQMLTHAFMTYSKSPEIFMLMVVGLFAILGTFMDAIPSIIVFTPILLPIAQSLGVHPVHLGVVVVMTMAMGLLTLPYGVCTLIACGIAKYPVSKVLGILHVLMLAIFVIILLSAVFPSVVLLVPRLVVPKWV